MGDTLDADLSTLTEARSKRTEAIFSRIMQPGGSRGFEDAQGSYRAKEDAVGALAYGLAQKASDWGVCLLCPAQDFPLLSRVGGVFAVFIMQPPKPRFTHPPEVYAAVVAAHGSRPLLLAERLQQQFGWTLAQAAWAAVNWDVTLLAAAIVTAREARALDQAASLHRMGIAKQQPRRTIRIAPRPSSSDKPNGC